TCFEVAYVDGKYVFGRWKFSGTNNPDRWRQAFQFRNSRGIKQIGSWGNPPRAGNIACVSTRYGQYPVALDRGLERRSGVKDEHRLRHVGGGLANGRRRRISKAIEVRLT